jgi:hypothetical protein
VGPGDRQRVGDSQLSVTAAYDDYSRFTGEPNAPIWFRAGRRKPVRYS